MPIFRDTEEKDGKVSQYSPCCPLSEFLTMKTVIPWYLWIWNLQIQRDNCTSLFYIRDLNIYRFSHPGSSWNQPPTDAKGWLYNGFWILALPLSTDSPWASYLNFPRLSFFICLFSKWISGPWLHKLSSTSQREIESTKSIVLYNVLRSLKTLFDWWAEKQLTYLFIRDLVMSLIV